MVHCNPVEKILPTGQVFPITNPNAHLACFNIKPPSTQPTPTVQVTNQFGTGTLIPGQPNLLCVPSWKSLTGPPGKKPAHAAQAQPLHLLPGAAGPWHAAVQPAAGHAQGRVRTKGAVNATVNPVPTELCLPTEKILASGKVFPIINPAMHLLCFPVTKTPIIPKVWDENQFGTSVVHIQATNWLCVPSTKKIVG